MSNYHFHRDCVYFDQCKLEEVKEGRHLFELFTCPALNHSEKYYPGDCNKIMWECGAFVPRQLDLSDALIKSLIPKEGDKRV